MVLLIPATYKWIKDKGKAEEREAQRKAQRKRIREAYRRFGVEMDGRLALPDTPEVDAFLNGEDPDIE